MSRSELAHHLPLRPRVLAVLASLAETPRTGVEILDGLGRTGVSILGPGSLYRVLRELRSAGWIERVADPALADVSDERRRYHALTDTGRAVLALEAARLRRTLAQLGSLGADETV